MTREYVCQHGNNVGQDDAPVECACMVIDGAIHPCVGCPASCGNCL